MGLFSWAFKEKPVNRIHGSGKYALDIVGE